MIDIDKSNRRNGPDLGCLGVNSTVEMAGHAPEAAGLMRRDLERCLSDLSDVIA
ncbi:hypothetical protein [Streptomyces sp. NPDC048248]|uniref:hypothetical protein n=1 Tax=Streptomyces sp. NPDC048248 TaxID=3365523 RepID=UPI0037130215